METTTFSTLISWVIAHGYFLFFTATLIDSQLPTVAAGIASALGYYNIFIIILIAAAGDLCADMICYAIGYIGRKTLLDKYGKYLGLTQNRIEKFDYFLRHYLMRTMVVVKLSPIIPIPSLIVIGSSKVSFKKFALASLIIALPKSALFGLIGFFSGKAYEHLGTGVTTGRFVFLGAIVVVILAYFGYKKLASYISKKLHAPKF